MQIFRATRLQSLRFSSLRTTNAVSFSTDDKKPDSSSSSSSSSSSDSDNESKPKRKNIESKEIPDKTNFSNKLNELLLTMRTTSEHLITKEDKLNIPKAGGRKQKKDKLKAEKQKLINDEKEAKDIFKAAKNVADLTKGGEEEKKLTEAELMTRLFQHIGAPDPKVVGNDVAIDGQNLGDMTLNDLIVGMKIDRTRPKIALDSLDGFRIKGKFTRKPNQYNENREGRRHAFKEFTKPATHSGSVNLFNSDTLGIFTKPDLKDQQDILPTWTHLYNRELRLSVTRPPANYFEKMARWTNQGKIWKFPIDNEQDLNDEAKVDFSEHVFLEHHLDGWCPEKGPIRHFMELVCVGLSKNPYIKASEKKAHILWYRDYFENKKDILKELIEDQQQSNLQRKQVKSS